MTLTTAVPDHVGDRQRHRPGVDQQVRPPVADPRLPDVRAGVQRAPRRPTGVRPAGAACGCPNVVTHVEDVTADTDFDRAWLAVLVDLDTGAPLRTVRQGDPPVHELDGVVVGFDHTIRRADRRRDPHRDDHTDVLRSMYWLGHRPSCRSTGPTQRHKPTSTPRTTTWSTRRSTTVSTVQFLLLDQAARVPGRSTSRSGHSRTTPGQTAALGWSSIVRPDVRHRLEDLAIPAGKETRHLRRHRVRVRSGHGAQARSPTSRSTWPGGRTLELHPVDEEHAVAVTAAAPLNPSDVVYVPRSTTRRRPRRSSTRPCSTCSRSTPMSIFGDFDPEGRLRTSATRSAMRLDVIARVVDDPARPDPPLQVRRVNALRLLDALGRCRARSLPVPHPAPSCASSSADLASGQHCCPAMVPATGLSWARYYLVRPGRRLPDHRLPGDRGRTTGRSATHGSGEPWFGRLRLGPARVPSSSTTHRVRAELGRLAGRQLLLLRQPRAHPSATSTCRGCRDLRDGRRRGGEYERLPGSDPCGIVPDDAG